MSDWLRTAANCTEPPPPLPPSFVAPPGLHDGRGRDAGDEQKTTAPLTALSVLIVDDSAPTVDTFVRYFTIEGFDAAGVISGNAALAMARERTFDAVVLDLCLQDRHGVAVLDDLRTAGLRAPVVMISGFGTAEEVAAAMKLGAGEFLSKPVDLDDLVRIVRRLVESSRAAGESLRPPDVRPRDPLADLRAVLNRMTWAVRPGQTRTRLVALLARAAARADLTAGQFLACAEALRRVVLSRREGPELAVAALQAIDRLQESESRARHPKVTDAMGILGAADGSGLALSAWALGRRVGVSGMHLGRSLRKETGLGFREWRRVFRLKRAARELAENTEHVRQIAFRVGYSDHGQFDHEFDQVFGLSPTEFRRALAGA